MFGVRAGNALVGVNLNKLSFGIAFDVLRVVQYAVQLRKTSNSEMEFREFLRSSDKTAWILCRVLRVLLKMP